MVEQQYIKSNICTLFLAKNDFVFDCFLSPADRILASEAGGRHPGWYIAVCLVVSPEKSRILTYKHEKAKHEPQVRRECKLKLKPKRSRKEYKFDRAWAVRKNVMR